MLLDKCDLLRQEQRRSGGAGGSGVSGQRAAAGVVGRRERQAFTGGSVRGGFGRSAGAARNRADGFHLRGLPPEAIGRASTTEPIFRGGTADIGRDLATRFRQRSGIRGVGSVGRERTVLLRNRDVPEEF